jgi:hypothetical protein
MRPGPLERWHTGRIELAITRQPGELAPTPATRPAVTECSQTSRETKELLHRTLTH